MLARLHHYEELKDHELFFKSFFGRGWHAELVKLKACAHSEICHVLARRMIMTKLLLPRLRALRDKLDAVHPGHNLANPPPKPCSASSTTP